MQIKSKEDFIMLKILSLTLSLVFLSGNMHIEARTGDFDPSSLSQEGRNAYKELLAAERFEDALIGRGAALSLYAQNFNILLEEQHSDAAFKSIFENGTLPGRLYGLSGLYFTDHARFQTEVEKYKTLDEMIQTISGCIVFDKPVAEIVVSKSENAVIIEPHETLEEYWEKNPDRYELDIAGGGFPASFRHFAEKKKTETE
jgi:hypothetical protein